MVTVSTDRIRSIYSGERSALRVLSLEERYKYMTWYYIYNG
jgi:hypothetical protein